MMQFAIAAALLTLAVVAWLLYPLLRKPRAEGGSSRRALNAAIYRDQLRELERDRAAGSLAAADYEPACAELQRRLLQDAAVDDATPHVAQPARRTSLALALLLPSVAALLYLWLGHPAAIDPPAAQQRMTAARIDDLVEKLAARMEKNPDDLKGWIMLARACKALHRYAESERAFEHAMKLGGNENADLLADYADLLATRAGGNIEGRPLELIERALTLEPDNMIALALAGSAAYARDDYAATLGYWEKLLKLLPAESGDAKSLAATLEEVRAKQAKNPAQAKTQVKLRTKPPAGK